MTTHREHRRGRADRIDLLHARGAHHEPRGELLVLSEGTGEERGVLSIAELLARRDRVNAHLLGVDSARRDTLGELVSVVSDQVRTGPTRLVLVALRDHGADRVRAADTLITIANEVDVPILAVPRDQVLLPTRVLVATDFSSGSIRAARTALSVLGPRGHLSLLHVEPEIDYEAQGHPEWRAESEEGIARLFDELRRELDEEAHALPALHRRRSSVVNDTILLRGEPAAVILRHATEHRNDLIVIGTRRVQAGDTMPLGSVAMAVLRAAHSAVLLSRPRSHAAPSATG